MRDKFHNKWVKLPDFMCKKNYLAYGMLLLCCLVTAPLFVVPAHAAGEPVLSLAGNSFDPHEQVGHDHHESTLGHTDNGVTLEDVLFYAVRAVYYGALMLAAGLMLWSRSLSTGQNESNRRHVDKYSLIAMRALLLSVLVFVFVHMSNLMKGFGGGTPGEWLRLLTETTTGRSWLILIVFALLGFAVLKLHHSFKMIWAVLLLGSESFNGHVQALPSYLPAIALDFIHLLCSALWAGGLMLLLLLWFADRGETVRFAEKFTKAAWLTIFLLTASGVGMTLLLLPSWLYLLYTSWGIMLLIKSALVVLVIVTGLLLHRKAKRRQLPSGWVLKADGLLMCMILIIASVFTYVSPVPHTEPLSHHEMGDTLHYTLAVTPNGPGPNQIKLKVWLPEQLGAPAFIQLRLQADDHPDRDAIEVPLLSDQSNETLVFPGFKRTDYYADKINLPSRGAWTAELVIIDKAGRERKETVAFRND